MAAQGSNVLAELGGGWLQCQDAQGIFYFNQATQQSSDVLPAELGGVPQQMAQPISYAPTQLMAQPQPQVQYLQPQMAQAQPQVQYLQQAQAQPQVQYLQQAQAQPQVQYLQQAQAQPQVQYLQQAQAQQFMSMAQPQPQVQYMQKAQAQPQVQYMQQAAQPQVQYVQHAQGPSYQPPMQAQVIQQQAAPQQAQSNVKLEVGDWLVCEDAQGEFYFHAPTGQSFDQAPPQLVELIRASQGPQVQMAQPNVAAQQAYGQQLAGNVQYVQYG